MKKLASTVADWLDSWPAPLVFLLGFFIAWLFLEWRFPATPSLYWLALSSDHAETAALLATGFVVALYTWEAKRLREETQRQTAVQMALQEETRLQTEIQIAPFLTITGPNRTGKKGTPIEAISFTISNIGKGPAIAAIPTIEGSKEGCPFPLPLDFLPGNGTYFNRWEVPDKQEYTLEINFRDVLKNSYTQRIIFDPRRKEIIDLGFPERVKEKNMSRL